ncbi:MAG: pyruvate ferredoxin oxidoreductase, partial [Methanobacteriota archaeon]
MRELQVLIGGRAGEGISLAGMTLAGVLNQIGYYTAMYLDYPSLIKGGHNFAIVRAGSSPLAAHRSTVDVLLALNQDCI